jgi:NitT/TauT family transport system substrate-binding protein
MSKKFSIILAIIIIAIVGVIVVVNKNKTPTPLEKKTITIADTRAISTALLPIAVEKNIFDKYGLNVKLLPVQTGDEALKAVVGKSADIALAAVTPYAFLAIDKPEMKIFVTVAESHDNQIIANKSKDISKPTDLKGKKIGYVKTTVSELGLEKFLQTNGMQKGDIQWINLKPLTMPAALFSGEIDAYSAWEPHLANGKKMLGDKAVIFTEPQNTFTWQMNLIADESYINGNKDALVRLIKALIEAEKFVSENKEEAIAITANHVNIPSDTLTSIWSKFEFKVNLRDDLANIVKENLGWANDRRETKSYKLPDSTTLVDKSIYEYAKSR